jgi:hypothetical protein
MSRRNVPTFVVAALLALIVAVFAAAGYGASGNGKGHRQSDPPCTINPSPVAVGETYVVTVSSLPTDTAINLWVTDPSGNIVGSPLGSAPTGGFNLNESSSFAGTWTYTFSGPTKNNPNTTAVYASCSVDAY